MSYRTLGFAFLVVILFTVTSYVWVHWLVDPLVQKISTWYQTSHQQEKITHSIKHLAIIMDGNRRWAKRQGLAAWLGHKKGIDPVKTTVEFCIQNNIPHLSLYTLSLENLKRSPEELQHIFALIEQGLTTEEFDKLLAHGVKINIVGDRSLFPAHLIPLFDDLEAKTKNGNQLTLNILFCYGGQQELVAAMQKIGTDIERGILKSDAITHETINKNLWIAHSPHPDLIIRTGGCNRLSNFLTWQSAYSELLFLPIYWPDITEHDLLSAVRTFNMVQRNFGK